MQKIISLPSILLPLAFANQHKEWYLPGDDKVVKSFRPLIEYNFCKFFCAQEYSTSKERSMIGCLIQLNVRVNFEH